MKKYVKKNWKWLLIGILGVFIIIPLFTQVLINIDTSNKGSNDGWLGFWGGYLGAIIGVAGAIYVVQIQLNEEKESREAEKVDNTFFNLLSMHNEQKNILNNCDVFEKIFKKFSEKLKVQLSEEGLSFFYLKKEIVVDSLQNLIRAYKKYIEKNEEKIDDDFLERWERKKRGETFSDSNSFTKEFNLYSDLVLLLSEVASTEEFIKKIEHEEYRHFSHTLPEGVYEILKHRLHIAGLFAESIEWDTPNELSEFVEDLSQYKSGHPELLSEGRRRKGIESAINDHYSEIGAYFRIFHRIIKYINGKVTDEATKKDYLGFLRSTLNEKELLVVFYNAAYTERGNGLLKEIRKTTFFGVYEELLEGYTVQHFNANLLVWKADDLEIMREFGNKEKEY